MKIICIKAPKILKPVFKGILNKEYKKTIEKKFVK